MAGLAQSLLCFLWCGQVVPATSLQRFEELPSSPSDIYVPEDDVVTVSVETFNHALTGGRKRADNKTQVVCFGDSITHGLCAGRHGSYPEQLQMMLGEDYAVTEIGACGRTITRSGKLPIWNEHALFQKATDAKPDIVVMLFGTNDAKEPYFNQSEFAFEYVELIQQVKAFSSAPKVYIMSPPPIYNAANQRDNISKNINSKLIDRLVRHAARATGIPAPIDLFTPFSDKCSDLDTASCELMAHKKPPSGGDILTCDNDGKHPSDEGYGEIARLVESGIL